MGLYDWFNQQAKGTMFDDRLHPENAAMREAVTNPIGAVAAGATGGNSSLASPVQNASAQAAAAAEAAKLPKGNDLLNAGDAADRNANWAKTLPSHLKPKIEKDKDGNEIVTIQGSLLNKIMRDMYSAGEEKYQLESMPEAANAGTPAYSNPEDYLRAVANDEKRQELQGQIDQRNLNNPYAQRPIQMQDQTTPQAEVLMRELMHTYPGRSPDEIARILRGGK